MILVISNSLCGLYVTSIILYIKVSIDFYIRVRYRFFYYDFYFWDIKIQIKARIPDKIIDSASNGVVVVTWSTSGIFGNVFSVSWCYRSMTCFWGIVLCLQSNFYIYFLYTSFQGSDNIIVMFHKKSLLKSYHV